MQLMDNSRIPMTSGEEKAVDALIAGNAGAAISFSRRDPGETGPVVVQINNAVYEVGERGEVRVTRHG